MNYSRELMGLTEEVDESMEIAHELGEVLDRLKELTSRVEQLKTVNVAVHQRALSRAKACLERLNAKRQAERQAEDAKL